ncbi:MAG: DUF4373 domain-containing protein [Paludibacter sp.]
MAGNEGFKYYNVDTDRYQDMKIKRLKKAFKCEGVAVYDYIICEVYRVKGCFTECSSEMVFDIAEYFGIEESLVEKIIALCCNLGLFDKIIYTKYGLITAHSIQLRFLEMNKRAKRYYSKIPENIDIIHEKPAIVPEKVQEVQENSAPEETQPTEIQEKTIYEKIDESALYLTCPEEQEWRDTSCMQNKISPDELSQFISEFTGLQKERGEYEVPKEFRKHFTNWLKIEKQKQLRNGNSTIQSKRGFGNSGNRTNPGITSSEDKRAKRQSLSDMAQAILQNP